MTTRRYNRAHLWLQPPEDQSAVWRLGVSDYAQQELGDVVYVELPAPGTRFNADEQIALIESVKTASEILAPCDLTVSVVNERLADEPELINTSALAEGYLLSFGADKIPLDELLDEQGYNEYLAGL